MPRLAVLITCYNRRNKTLDCLQALFSQMLPCGVELRAFLVDDGSTDGTGDAVREGFPAVRVIEGTGQLFWCGGMRLAWQHASEESPDAYLWLNDDTLIVPGALAKLLAVADMAKSAGQPPTIIVGSCRDPVTSQHTYGGQRRVSRHPLILTSVTPSDRPQPCDTFQGNIVLVPREVYERVGMLDRFQHAMGDTDYGYRAVRAGCQCLVAPDYSGTCAKNPGTTYWYKGPRRRERWRLLNSRKGLPPADWLKFAFRHGGAVWPFHWLKPYLRVLLNR